MMPPVLTGRETLAATFAATGHRYHATAALHVGAGDQVHVTTWRDLSARVRVVALGWDEAGHDPGEALAVDPDDGHLAVTVRLLVAAVTGAVAVVADGTDDLDDLDLDLDALASAGAMVDDRHPDRFESLVARRVPDEALVRRGAITHTNASLLVAGRSLSRALGVGVGDRIVVDLAPASIAALVAGVVLPCLTGAASQVGCPPVTTGEVGGQVHTLVAAGRPRPAPPAPPPEPRRRRRRRRARVADNSGATSDVVVLDTSLPRLDTSLPRLDAGEMPPDGGSANALALDAAGGIVTGFGPLGTLGRPLPGASIAVDEAGVVFVRSGAVAPGAPGTTEDGWLPTGLEGRLVEGALVLGGEGG